MFKIIIPFSYFFKSRLNSKKDILFLLSFELLPSFGLLFLFLGHSFDLNIALSYVFLYIAFISIYEIGYIYNDLIATKKEKNPRKRLGDYDPKFLELVCLIGLRILLFFWITFWLSYNVDYKWFTFYGILGLTFYLHNIIISDEIRIYTFLSLSLIRFIAPIFMFLDEAMGGVLIATTFINYSFYRTLNYAESKGVLRLKEKNLPLFRMKIYGVLLIVNIFLFIILNSYIQVIHGFFCLLLMFGYYLINRKS